MIASHAPNCPQCHIGHLRLHSATYMAITQGMLVSIPNTRQWHCDVCGYREYDSADLARLELMAGIFPDLSEEAARAAGKVTPPENDLDSPPSPSMKR